MNYNIQYPDDGSLLVHFNQGEVGTVNAERGTRNGERKTKTIRIDAFVYLQNRKQPEYHI